MVSKKRPRVMYFPTLDFLSPYQQKKKLLELAGKVVTYNMYDEVKNLPSLEELDKMDYETARNIVATAKEKHSVKRLKEHWKVTGHGIYKKVFPKYGILVNGAVDTTKAKKTTTVKLNAEKIQPVIQPVVKEIVNVIPEPVKYNGFEIRLEGEFKGEEICDRLLRLTELIRDNSDYSIKLLIAEQ